MFRQGRAKEATKAFQKAVEFKPDYGDAHYNLGMVLAQQGQTGAAIEHLREALRYNPENEQARQRLRELGIDPAK